MVRGETVLSAWLAPDAGAYWRSHAVMALIGGVVAGIGLVFGAILRPGSARVAAAGAIGLRAAYLKSEAFAEHGG